MYKFGTGKRASEQIRYRMKKRIYIREWLSLKPYQRQVQTDAYYLALCNNVKEILLQPEHFLLLRCLEEEDIHLLCCFLVSYFEDVISQTNIWNTFIQKHAELFGKRLPFYPTVEYDENEINEQDVSFLTWYFLNTIQEDKFVSPYNESIARFARNVMDLFEEEYERAPENEDLIIYYSIDQSETDFYVVRKFIEQVLFKSYLFWTDTRFRLRKIEEEVLEDERLKKMGPDYLNEIKDSFLHRWCTRLLGLKGKEWGAEILGKSHPLYTELYRMSPKIFGYFLYKGQNDTHITLEHIASEKSFLLTKESFGYSDKLIEIDTIVAIGIVKWREEWWFSGAYTQQEFDEHVVRKEKNLDLVRRKDLSFLDEDECVSELLQKQGKTFLEFNNSSHIAFLPSDKIEQFLNDYFAYYNKSQILANGEPESLERTAWNKEYFKEGKGENPVFSKIAASGLVFYNPKSGIEIALSINSAFPAKENPYYEDDESEEAIYHLLMSKEFSRELVLYCIDHYRNDLPFFTDGVGKRYLDDLDFLLRFWKRESYHTISSVSSS